jgi:hypothetical protein
MLTRTLATLVAPWTLACCAASLLGACRSAPQRTTDVAVNAALGDLVTPNTSGSTIVPLGEEAPAAWQPAALDSLPPAPRAQEPVNLEPYPNLHKRFGLSLGGAAYGNFNTNLRVDSNVVVGASIDLEDTLGVDEDSFVARLDGFYSFNERHRVDFSVYDISRSGTRTLLNDIQVGDTTFPAGAGVETDFDTTILKLAYRYNFVTDYRTVIGASAGIHGMAIDAKLSAPGVSLSEEFEAIAPLPVLGLHGEYALSKRWKMLASVEMLQIDIGTARGFLSDQRLSIEHNAFENFGWGFGYNGFNTDLKIEGDGPLTAEFDYDFQGLMLYIRWFL